MGKYILILLCAVVVCACLSDNAQARGGGNMMVCNAAPPQPVPPAAQPVNTNQTKATRIHTQDLAVAPQPVLAIKTASKVDLNALQALNAKVFNRVPTGSIVSK